MFYEQIQKAPASAKTIVMIAGGFHTNGLERILKETPETRQTALFSATMPSVIKRIATTYLDKPEVVTVAAKTGTADNIRQRYWLVSGMQKLDALTRIEMHRLIEGLCTPLGANMYFDMLDFTGNLARHASNVVKLF